MLGETLARSASCSQPGTPNLHCAPAGTSRQRHRARRALIPCFGLHACESRAARRPESRERRACLRSRPQFPLPESAQWRCCRRWRRSWSRVRKAECRVCSSLEVQFTTETRSHGEKLDQLSLAPYSRSSGDLPTFLSRRFSVSLCLRGEEPLRVNHLAIAFDDASNGVALFVHAIKNGQHALELVCRNDQDHSNSHIERAQHLVLRHISELLQVSEHRQLRP